jgi:hypothetical protein
VQQSQTETEKILSNVASGPIAAAGKLVKVAQEALERRGWSPAEATQIIDKIRNTSGAEQKEVIEKTVEKTVIMTIKEELGFGSMPDSVIHTFRPAYRAGPNEAIFYNNGNPILVEMAPELAKAIKGIDPEGPNILMKILSLPAKTLRAGATLTPEFAARNPLRDQMTAWVFSKYGYIPGLDLVRGIYHVLKVDDIYQKYLASGAAQASLVSLDREYLSKSVEEITKMMTPGDIVRHPGKAAVRFVTASIKNPLKTMQIISELSEVGSRVGGFARGLAAEGNDLNALMKAAIEGRDMTLDFGRAGLKGKAINAIVAFWNAQIQGTDKMVRAFKERPGSTFLKAFLGITAPSLLLWYAQHDDPYYDEIPDWRKILFWNFIIKNDDGSLKLIFSVPKPFEIGLIFGSVPTMALDWMKTNDPERFKKTIHAAWEALLPGIVPTAALPWIENYANRSLFFDRPISPRGSEDLSPYLQYSERTSETMKIIAKGLNEIPGIRNYANPAKIENLIRGYTGGMGQYALESSDSILKAMGITKTIPRPSMTLSDLPLIKGFIQRWPTSNAQSIEDFYKKYTENKTKWQDSQEIKGIRGKGFELSPAIKLALDMPPELLYQEKVAEHLSALRKQAKQVRQSQNMNEEQKREAIDAIYMLMTNISRAALNRPSIKNKR